MQHGLSSTVIPSSSIELSNMGKAEQMYGHLRPLICSQRRLLWGVSLTLGLLGCVEPSLGRLFCCVLGSQLSMSGWLHAPRPA